MKALVFPGQGSQFVGMGQELSTAKVFSTMVVFEMLRFNFVTVGGQLLVLTQGLPFKMLSSFELILLQARCQWTHACSSTDNLLILLTKGRSSACNLTILFDKKSAELCRS